MGIGEVISWAVFIQSRYGVIIRCYKSNAARMKIYWMRCVVKGSPIIRIAEEEEPAENVKSRSLAVYQSQVHKIEKDYPPWSRRWDIG
jgi:hypothetical protein